MLLATRYTCLLRGLSCWYLQTSKFSLLNILRTSRLTRYPFLYESLSIPLQGVKIREYSGTTESQTTQSNKLLIRDSYVSRYHQVVSEPNQFIRLSVEGGGCSGFQYEFNLDTEVREDDVILERDGARLLVDTVSLELLQGATVEYHEELIRSAFRVVDIPSAESACSCGASFAIKS